MKELMTLSDSSQEIALPQAFEALGVRPSLLRALAAIGFQTPSPIQALLIPRALAGSDLLGQARTGTGKTAAFGIPILQNVERGTATQALILLPTRELAMQVDEELKRLGQFTPIRSVAVFGGQRITSQLKLLDKDPEIIVGTPGRVIDLLDRRIIDLSNLRFAVLDEVDRMLDIGFRDDIRNILSRVKGIRRQQQENEAGTSHDEAPSQHVQTIFVSATIAGEIERLARSYMHNPEKLIAPGADEKPTVENVQQYYVSVQPWDKYRLLRLILEKETPELAIIFCRTKHGAEKVAKRLHADGIECREIHGNLNQNKRSRVMKNFRGGKFDVLVATDLASRGIDVAHISHIINYDIPEDPEAYVHRVGRTARMGAAGRAFTFVTREQGGELTRIERLINMLIEPANIEGFEPTPTPSDWEQTKPQQRGRSGSGGRSSRPAASVAASSAASPAASEAAAKTSTRPLTIGSHIPRSHRRRRR